MLNVHPVAIDTCRDLRGQDVEVATAPEQLRVPGIREEAGLDENRRHAREEQHVEGRLLHAQIGHAAIAFRNCG